MPKISTNDIFCLRYGEGEESTLCRKLLLQLISKMGSLHWKFLGSTNIKGGTDSLFFQFDEQHVEAERDLAMLSFNRHDRIRLIDFEPHIANVVRNTVLRLEIARFTNFCKIVN
jgi:hypothetical protein